MNIKNSLLKQKSLVSRLIRNPWFAAGLIALGIAIYLLSATVININDDSRTPPQRNASADNRIATVQIEPLEAQSVQSVLTLYGATASDRTVTLSAELAATVVSIEAKRGTLLNKGDQVLQLDQASLPLELAAATARLALAQQEYDSALALQQKGHLADNLLVQRRAELASAQALQAQLQDQLSHTQVTAPISGILNKRYVEQGDFLDKGQPLVEIIDLNPLVVTVEIPQAHILSFQTGQSALVHFADGTQAAAQIRFIDRQANPETRTFSAELMLDNAEMTIPAGLSVTVDLLGGMIPAVAISPAWLSLNELGEAGIKWVAEDDKGDHIVQFSAADIVKSEQHQLWVAGLPQSVAVITVGHGFVRAGDVVTVKSASGGE